MSSTARPFHNETRSEIVSRRLVTIPRSIVIAVMSTLLLPMLLTAALLVDATRWMVTRKPFMAIRLVLFGWVYAVVEIIGLAWMFAIWVVSGFGTASRRLVAWTWPVQAWWAGTLLAAVRRIFDLGIEVRGLDVARPGPIVAMFRHASIIDNLLPGALLQQQLGFRLRWLLKRELLDIPALDVAGTRLPNHFVDRKSASPRKEILAIKSLAADLDVDEGVLIYPEGTRFTPDRRRRALEELSGRSPKLAERAERLRHTMPPQVGGPLTLLDTGYDVVVCAHEGLGGFAKISDIWSGDLVGRHITIAFWRIPATEIPVERSVRIEWLFDTWAGVDAWVAANRPV